MRSQIKQTCYAVLALASIIPLALACEPATPEPTPTRPPTQIPTRTIIPIPTKTITPTPVGPRFSGRIIAFARTTLFELAATADSALAGHTQIASDVMHAAISPDLRDVVYSTGYFDEDHHYTGDVHVYDLENRTDIVILPRVHAHSFAWSPDGQRFGYIVDVAGEATRGLYVYEMTSNDSRLVFAPPCATYGALQPQGVCGKYSAGFWITPNIMLFQRYKGAMPPEVTSPLYPEVNSNATTLYVSDSSPPLVDLPQRRYVQDSCGHQILLREETNGSILFSLADTTEFIAQPGSVEPRLVLRCVEHSSDCLSLSLSWPGHPSPYLGYIPRSCTLFYLAGAFPDYSFRILNPETLDGRSLPFPTRGAIAFPSDFALTDDWANRPDTDVAVMSETLYPTIEIVNLQTARKTTIWSGKDMPQRNSGQFRLLAWIVR